MTVKELIEKLSEFDDDLIVWINGETLDVELSYVVQVDYVTSPSEVVLS